MKQIRKTVFRISLVLLFATPVLPTVETQAQCPMCRMSAESNLKNGGTAGRGLNRGILYILSMPYILVGTMGFIWWRNRETGVDLPDPELN